MAFLLFACLYWALMLSPQDVQSDLLERKYTLRLREELP